MASNAERILRAVLWRDALDTPDYVPELPEARYGLKLRSAT
jgi:hypothetical protein